MRVPRASVVLLERLFDALAMSSSTEHQHFQRLASGLCLLCIHDPECAIAVWDGKATCHIKTDRDKPLSDHAGYTACRAREQ